MFLFGDDFVFLGAPTGGFKFSDVLGVASTVLKRVKIQSIYAEKKVTEKGSEGKRDKTELVFDRHELAPGKRVILVEDVCNNFSTTEELCKLVDKHGSFVAGIACILNRSSADKFKDIPVFAIETIPTVQFKQEDPAVRDDIDRGNIEWKPKPTENWLSLITLMKEARARLDVT